MSDHNIMKQNLTQRAYLNSITSILDYSSKLITGFIVTPFLISGLGDILFGVWQILGQLSGYTDFADIRASQVLKWAIAKDRDSLPDKELKKYVTATFLLTLFMLPIFLLISVIIIWYSPQITGVGSEYADTVRMTTSLVILSVLIFKLFSIFESILRGMNLGYKRMGFRASIFIAIGFIKILAIKMGYGLIELALIQVLNSLIISFVIYIIIKKHVPWFGFEKINYKETKSFFKTSGWFMGWMSVQMVIINSDKVLLGYLAGPVFVTKYVITKYLSYSILSGFINNIVHGALPGIGNLFGKKEYKKLSDIRQNIMVTTLLFSVGLGFIILLFNHSFIGLWSKADLFIGQKENLIILVMVVQYIFIQNDSTIINTTLDIKSKTIIGLFSAIISILGVFVFIKIYNYGIMGLCLGLIVGRLIQSISYPIIINKKIQVDSKNNFLHFRSLIISISVLSLGYYLGNNIVLQKWTHLIFLSALIFPLIIIFIFYLGFKTEQRSEIMKYASKIRYFKKN